MQATGTGTSLVADGHDAALLRASVLDGEGRVMHLASNNISFRVVSGKFSLAPRPARLRLAQAKPHGHLDVS